MLAIDEINGAGGVLGKQVRVISEDDQSKADEAVIEIESRRPVTEKQRAFINSLAEQTGVDLTVAELDTASIRDASRVIEELTTQVPPTDRQREYVASLASELGVEVRLLADATWASVSRSRSGSRCSSSESRPRSRPGSA